MKKVLLFAAVAMMASAFVACGSSTPAATTSADSVAVVATEVVVVADSTAADTTVAVAVETVAAPAAK